MGFNQLIAAHLAERDDHSQDLSLQGIYRASDRLLRTIGGLIDLSKIEAGAFEIHAADVDVLALLAQHLAALRPAAAEKGIVLESRVAVTQAIVRFDEYCLSQSVANLLDNAVKFTDRGQVTVRLVAADDGSLVLKIADTGVGIAPEFLARVFNPFVQENSGYSRSFEGSGLGLTLVKRYLEGNGASVSALSEKGQGSTFRVRFPKGLVVSMAEASGQNVHVSREAPAGEKRPRSNDEAPTVLVVEDDLETQLFMKRLLAKRYRVELGANEADCESRLRDKGEEIRLILMDLSLKDSTDGLKIVRSLRASER